MSKSIISAEVIAFPEMGPEAVRRLTVKNMPLIVINDTEGRDLYKEEGKSIRLAEFIDLWRPWANWPPSRMIVLFPCMICRRKRRAALPPAG